MTFACARILLAAAAAIACAADVVVQPNSNRNVRLPQAGD